MKWYVFTGACVAALIAVGILAVDERDVEWELDADGSWQPLCGYCRSTLKRLAVVCPTCDRSLDWIKHRTSCSWCLDRDDAEHLRDLFDDLGVNEEPLPGTLAGFPAAYFKVMDAGTCTYCGGTGVIAESRAEVNCPVCQGDKRCISCGGGRIVTIGDEDAYRRLRERQGMRSRAERRASITDRPLRRTLLLQQDIDRLRGYLEIEQYSYTRQLLDRASERLERAFKALHEETVRRNKEAPTRGS